jgi:hypothetical protein
MNICVVGSGTYGSYIIDCLRKKYPDAKITLYEVGDSAVQSEKEIGFFSSLKQSRYKGLTDGRWFGFGGTSNKWGGQLLTFTENDFSDPSPFMQDIIRLNKKHRTSVFGKFDLANKNEERKITEDLYLKTSVWLSYFRRSFFKYFKVNKRSNVEIKTHARVTRFRFDENKNVEKVLFKKNGEEREAVYDFYFLAAGAFENARILLNSDILPADKVPFSDHLTQKVFRIKNSTTIGEEDFSYRISGTSMITKRFVGEVDGFSFYAHPVLNTDFPLFQSLKTLMYKRNFSFNALSTIVSNTPKAMAFLYSLLVKKKIYMLTNDWFMYIDIENPTDNSYVALSGEKDEFGEFGLDVFYNIGDKSEKIYSKATESVKKHLEETNTVFEEKLEAINVETVEDIYHPYGMFCDYKSMDAYFNEYGNMLPVSTGLLPRSGGINPTAAVLPLIEEFVNNYLSHK